MRYTRWHENSSKKCRANTLATVSLNALVTYALQAGTSNAGFWQSTHEEDFSRTPLGVNEYRMEVFHAPYEFRPNRPRITTRTPTFVPYGTSFDVGFAFDSPADIAGVVLVNAGGVSCHTTACLRQLSCLG